MTRQELSANIFSKQSYLCVGLDTDPDKLPHHLKGRPDAVFAFNKAIIDATLDFCVAYKINTAFYEAQGLKGWETMARTAAYIPNTHFKIADAKRGDIGNTSAQYARAFFEELDFDALTVAPYMGEDSLRPFLEYANKWTIVLGLTSNKGAADFEKLPVVMAHGASPTPLYETVLRKASEWGTEDNLMFVIGATQSAKFGEIRRITPRHFYLVPGIGVQGGSLSAISEEALIPGGGLLVNASRAILYTSEEENFAEEARRVAHEYAVEMGAYLQNLPKG